MRVLLTAAPGAVGMRTERAEQERLNRRVDVYPLEGGRVRVEVESGRPVFHAVLVERERPERELPHAKAVEFSWRRDDSGPLERPEAGVIETVHHGRPVDLVYAAPPGLRASLRVRHQRHVDKAALAAPGVLAVEEMILWGGAGIWLGIWGLAWGYRRLK